MLRDRRAFIRKTSALAASVTVSGMTAPAISASAGDVRSIELLALHTNEYLSGAFWARGKYIEPNLAAIDHLLRDHRTDEMHRMDPRLLNYLHDLANSLGVSGPFHVISGYRSAATNAQLRRKSSGVARRSFHMFGRAVDVRMPDVPTAIVRDAAIALERGGVGYYPRSDFIHLDTGKYRHWG